MATDNGLSYPPNLGELKHWVYFRAKDYKSVTREAKWDCQLYIPPDALATSYKSDYEAAALGMAAGTADQLLQASKGGNIDALKASIEAQTSTLKNTIVDAVATGGGNETARIMLSRSKGVVRNPYIVAAYKGPSDMRTHKFSFVFHPKNVNESKVVTKIINKFKSSMLPAYAGGDNATAPTALMGYPDTFEIEFIINGKRLPRDASNPMFRIGKSVLTACDVSYTTQDVPLFFEGTQYPVFAQMSLEFMEMQIMTRDKIDGGVDQQGRSVGGH